MDSPGDGRVIQGITGLIGAKPVVFTVAEAKELATLLPDNPVLQGRCGRVDRGTLLRLVEEVSAKGTALAGSVSFQSGFDLSVTCGAIVVGKGIDSDRMDFQHPID